MSLSALSLAALLLLPVVGPQAPATDVTSLGLIAEYDVQAHFDWTDGRVEVATTATITNPHPWSVSSLVFNLSTLRTGRAALTGLSVDGTAVEPVIDDQTIIVPLPRPLAPRGQTVVQIDSQARLNRSPRDDSDEWGFALTDNRVTAYRWIPWLSRTTPFDRPSVGDPFVTASSPHVRVELSVDHDVVFATSGQETGRAGASVIFEAHDVRDFNFSASPDYKIEQRTVRGTPITLFYRRLPAADVLDVAARAMATFSDRIGPYPYAGLTIAEIGPWAPLESPGHFWLPSNASARLLPWMTAHETGHQWFYAVVGNDQARQPFADEALTDFISRDLISRFVASKCPTDDLDQTIYDLGECYPWVTYVQGVAFLRDMRDRVGGAAFWRGVANYYADYRFGIGGTRELLLALDRASGRLSRHADRFPRLWPVPIACLPFAR